MRSSCRPFLRRGLVLPHPLPGDRPPALADSNGLIAATGEPRSISPSTSASGLLPQHTQGAVFPRHVMCANHLENRHSPPSGHRPSEMVVAAAEERISAASASSAPSSRNCVIGRTHQPSDEQIFWQPPHVEPQGNLPNWPSAIQ